MTAIEQIEYELQKAKEKWPDWVSDPIHAASIINEEAGELTQACNDFCYSAGDPSRMATEAAQLGAMCIRFLENMHEYWRTRTYLSPRKRIP